MFADIDGVFCGYFFALAGGTTTIRRIHLDQQGQVAEIIKSLPADIDIVSSHGNLVTDGSFLYWQRDTAINKMPIQGGAITHLDTTSLTRPATGLHLNQPATGRLHHGPNLIYAVDNVVCYVPADGSAVTPPQLRVVFTAEAGVVACASRVTVAGDDVTDVADRDGGIVSHSANGTFVAQTPGNAFITSMAGAEEAWTQMAAAAIAPGQVEAAWQLRLTEGVNDYTFTTGANPRLALYNDGSHAVVFWLDDNGVVTYNL